MKSFGIDFNHSSRDCPSGATKTCGLSTFRGAVSRLAGPSISSLASIGHLVGQNFHCHSPFSVCAWHSGPDNGPDPPFVVRLMCEPCMGRPVKISFTESPGDRYRCLAIGAKSLYRVRGFSIAPFLFDARRSSGRITQGNHPVAEAVILQYFCPVASQLAHTPGQSQPRPGAECGAILFLCFLHARKSASVRGHYTPVSSKAQPSH